MSQDATQSPGTSNDARLEARIYGRVQGVGFRYFVLEQAQTLRLTGTVRNVYFPRRMVEVVAEGPRPQLEQFLRALHRGPSMARVEQVDVQWSAARNEFSSFRIV
ncbi:MAG: acylphosphatase [Caldilineae bacterium]|nr:MAG: acylphosphatase [Caldilineae bacterium]